MMYANELFVPPKAVAANAAAAAPQAEYPLVYRNLMAISLLASVHRLHDEAEIVHAAVELTLADATQYRMCRAVAQSMGGNTKGVEETLLNHLEMNPDDDSAKVTLGVAMMLSGNPDWQRWIDNVLATSTDQSVREVANAVLTEFKALSH
jgi:hypothetical protein